MKPGVYWGLLTPEDDGVPEMFFRSEPWAKAALNEFIERAPQWAGLVRLVRVRVTFEVLS